MKLLLAWMKAHPLLVAGFSSVFTWLATSIAFLPEWLLMGTVIYCALAVVVAGLIYWQSKALLVLVLSVSLILPPPARAEEQGGTGGAGGCAAAAVAVVVIVIGGIIIYKIGKFCQRKFPKTKPPATNDPPAELVMELGGQGGDTSYAAGLNFGELGSCYQGDICSDQRLPDQVVGSVIVTTCTLLLRVEPETIRLMSMQTQTGNEAVQSWAEFVSEAKALGVVITGHAGDFSYALNGQPIPATASPIRWDASRRLVKVSNGSAPYYTVVVERSNDLFQWVELLRTEVEVGSTIQVQDANPGGQQFYRYSGFLSD